MDKINRSYIRHVRHAVQWGILSLLVYAGYEFFLFEQSYSGLSGQPGASLRPPSVEGFLPIGALMSLKLWLTTGIFDRVHPAGLVIFISALMSSLFIKKGFCGWICPVGTISELAWKIGARLFGRNFRMHRYMDLPLRSVKYLLTAFFFYVIVFGMSPGDILRFVESDYYKIADVKMLYFFTKMTSATMITLSLLLILSLFYKNFWCRYLCPYGALLGIISFLSPVKIARNEAACTHCKKCTKHCPALLPVEKKTTIRSAECTGCLTCVSNCPARGALDMSFPGKRPVHPVVYAVVIVALLFGTIAIGKATGNWKSAVTHEEYQRIIPQAGTLEHP